MSSNENAYEFGPFRLYLSDLRLFRDGVEVPLQPQVAKLLLVLVEAAGQRLDAKELIKRAWDVAYVTDSSVHFQISNLRAALKDPPGASQYIKTWRRSGYEFVAPVRRVTVPPVSGVSTIQSDGVPVPGQRPATPGRYRPGVFAVIGVLGAAALAYLVTIIDSEPRAGAIASLTQDGQRKELGLIYSGGRLYFSLGQSRQLASVSANGGQTIPLELALKGFDVLDINTTRSEFLVKRVTEDDATGELWVAPMFGGQRRRVADVMCQFASWSSDGQWIACVRASELSIVNADGSNDGSSKAFPVTL